MKNVFRSFALVVLLPTLFASFYFAFVASDMYVSETRFAVRASRSDGGGGLASLLTSSVIPTGSQDTRVVIDYIKSQDMLATLEETLNLSKHYSAKSVDIISRLKESPTREELLKHHLKHIEIVEDSGSGIVILKYSGYTPEYSQRVAQHIVSLSESLVNALSSRIESDALDSAKNEVAIAAAKVRAASDKLSKFRAINASINPAEETSALLGLLSGLEGKLATAKTELSEKRAFMRESSSVVKSLKHKVGALERQITQERKRVAGEGGQGMNELISDYQPLALDQELAQLQYTSALTSLELARVEAQRKKQYLVTFVKPVLPEQSLEPRRVMKSITVLVYSFLFFAIGGLLWSALRDHIGH